MSADSEAFDTLLENDDIINYLIMSLERKERKKERKTHTHRLDPELYSEFYRLCLIHNLAKPRRINRVLEAFMRLVVNKLQRRTVVQSTLFYKPNITVNKTEVNIATKLEVKLVKEEITSLLDQLDSGKGSKSFFMTQLKKKLPRAIRLYQKTLDPQIERALKRAEQYVSKEKDK